MSRCAPSPRADANRPGSDDISVVIPTFNGARFIRETIESVFAQTRLPCEILVVDDCSTDDTMAVLDTLARESPVPLRPMQLKRNTGGPAGPLNAGIEAASSDWIAILEQDDVAPPDRLERQSVAVATHPGVRFSSGRAVAYGTGGDTTRFFWGAIDQFADVVDGATLASNPPHFTVGGSQAFRVLVGRQFLLTNSSYFFHKSLWRDVGGFDPETGTCADLAFAMVAAAHTDIALVNATVVEHRLHDASLNRRQPTMALLKGEFVRMELARLYPRLAGRDWRDIYWHLRVWWTAELWKRKSYRALGWLIVQLARQRFSSKWRT